MNKIKILFENFLLVFKNWKYLVFGILVFIMISYLFFYFTHSDLIIGNEGLFYFSIQVFFQIGISLLFAIFLPISFYKYFLFSKFNAKENSTSLIGTFFGIVVAGCPACSVTVASYIGLAGIISLLPYHGLELKAIGFFLLIYANYSVLKDLQVCKIDKKRKK